ncbi:alpha/beta hydrolase [Dongia sp.]|uniref:alpha/beta hydrolase n=1 Tax=Dongia sp. TaxID=1977262 RepID=UPI0035AFB406
MTTQIAPADAAVAAFIADSDNLFTAAYDLLPMAEQRRLYDSYWQRYHAPRPEGVSVEEVRIPRSDGASGSGACRALLYRPARSAGPLATIVYFHGGGWMLGSPESHDLATARICAWTGAAVLSVDYRLSPEHVFPDALMDGLAAVKWVAREGRGRGLDPDRLAVAGDSAGGNLAAGLCLWIRDHGGPVIRHQTLIYPALTVRAAGGQSVGVSTESLGHYVTGYFGGQALSNNSYAMPLSAKSFAGLPPACVATAEMDPILPHGEKFVEHLRHAGITCDYTCGKGLPHTYLRLIHLSAAAQSELEFCCGAIRSALALQQNKVA